MRASSRDLTDREFDVLVLGSGMFGAAVAWYASKCGYSVALIDKSDFGGATSANHYKFIHSGIRYLQHLDVIRVRSSNQDRKTLMRVAPHLTRIMPVLYPTYGFGLRGKTVMRCAMGVFDLMTADRNSGVTDPHSRIPNGKIIGKDQVLEQFPALDPQGLTGAAVFCDGQMYNPPRLVFSFVKTAVQSGAVAANYVEAQQLLKQGDRIVGAAVEDRLSGEQFEIRSKIVINAAGPWAFPLYESIPDINLPSTPTFSRDLAFVVNKSLNQTYALASTASTHDSDAILDRGGRHLFLVPWRGMTLVGVWHRPERADPDGIVVRYEELRKFVAEINSAYPGAQISMDDISMVNTGHILYGSASTAEGSDQHKFAKRSLLLDHRKYGLTGLLTLVGARATVGPSMAKKSIKLAASQIGTATSRPGLQDTPLVGGDFSSFASLIDGIQAAATSIDRNVATTVARNYGSSYDDVLKCADLPEQLEPFAGTQVMKAEAIHAVRHEAAATLADVVLRRTELGPGGLVSDANIVEAAKLVGAELNWSQDQRAEQVSSVQNVLTSNGPWNFV